VLKCFDCNKIALPLWYKLLEKVFLNQTAGTRHRNKKPGKNETVDFNVNYGNRLDYLNNVLAI